MAVKAAGAAKKPGQLTIVIKLGTSSIVDEKTHEPLLPILTLIVDTAVKLRKNGHRVVIVSSGAIGVGLRRMDIDKRPKHLAQLQASALAAIGQCRLVSLWDSLFAHLSQPVAQILMTRNDIADVSGPLTFVKEQLADDETWQRTRYINAQNTFNQLMEMGVIPIVNENDTLAVSEIKFGDNDTLSAITAAMVHADMLFLMTDVDCLYDKNPRTHPDARPIEIVSDISTLEADVSTAGSSLGTGGMSTKIVAARLGTLAGVTTIITRSSNPGNILGIVRHMIRTSTANTPSSESDEQRPAGSLLSKTACLNVTDASTTEDAPPPLHTRFLPSNDPIQDRYFWLLHTPNPRGTLFIDVGCYRALLNKAGLLPVGVVDVQGHFGQQDVVRLAVVEGSPPPGPDGRRSEGTTQEVGRAVVNYSASEIKRIMGHQSVEIHRAFAASRKVDAYQVVGSRKRTTDDAMASTATTLKGQPLEKPLLDALLRRRMFYTPSFEIYNGVGGLYDYGPPGCALQTNIVDLWRKHFVLEEDMLEVDCTVLTPHEVLKTSGHVDKFADWMCKDPKNGDILRADHFVEAVLEARLNGNKEARGQKVEDKDDAKKKKKKAKSEAVALDDAVVTEYEEVLARIDNYDGPQLGELIKKYQLKNPDTGEIPSEPVQFNLMFQTSIGPSSNLRGYLRPETAQGQFLNFAKLLAFNQSQMPFASASIGKSYRNEISPRAGLLRVREFLMAEIEHFVDPQGGKKHSRFHEVEHVELVLLDRETQLSGKTETRRMTVGQAVKTRLVDNETLGYFLARIHLFLQKIGVDLSKMRFRQHMQNEMAHYACDCWDAELFTTSGWVECVGCADRSAYDLSVHAKKTGAPLVVRERLDEPLTIEDWQVDIEKKKFGPQFKKDAKAVEDALLATTQEQREKMASQLAKAGSVTLEVPGVADGKVDIKGDSVKIEFRKRVENTREYTPNVIEPSFGIGRILYALVEHNFWTRASDGGDEARGVLSFPPIVAPTKVLLVPLSSNAQFKPAVKELSQKLRRLGVSSRVDDSSASIGKRYSRNDELGTPLGVTVDFQTLQDGTVTLRDRDSTTQVRAAEKEILAAIQSLVDGTKDWATISSELPKFEGQEVEVAAR
ncbi:hypothetical protein L249_2131 [Ophiocordyceps polyrhachis-furcata BCC 54312]|uniref:glycine--tRNA ligase n=1 Tax=Ophiocordyceps polyrhachis-furcata BCC 54312 TaxID=1330021 RepID=A0A367LNY0_9HYPO|nr:hypothetical protein L249_2131 [Ophiocordyceps polyrhachis-furcata BCC 54312]